ncbi:protein yls9 [Phtheirospermum japonicum]|uniref:Protein yls9 n=1 Tax=Phtheirospermum japonicum TaxID=374723 RepID=A0A830DJK4_9LAMI|nr:protein yls9 [Phtheirospermum japonicum]
MTTKDCGHHDEHRKRLHRRLLAGLISLVAAVLLTVLLVWLILRPTKPRFVLQDAAVYAFNLTPPNFLTANLQITLSSRNPNGRVGIYYDRVDVYAAYHSQQITLATRLPASYQGHKDITVWSPFLYAAAVPVAPYLAAALEQDEAAGAVLVNIRVDGRVRWKVGTFISGEYHMYVNCPAYIHFGNKIIKYQLIMDCHVDV